ncbi:hypothetical protein [Sinomonas sp. P10A9]|uniref:Uncharacterized protein n=1 Tax=Sinomonas puerhi TaxID=3238584 RepID=A0AB39L5V4_9MICC
MTASEAVRRTAYAVSALLLAAVLAAPSATAARPEPDPAGNAHVSLARGVPPRQARATQSPDMTYHGGTILDVVPDVRAIFWGTTWPTDAGDKISGLDRFYGGMSASEYARTSDEYTQSGPVAVTSTMTYNGHVQDSSPASSSQSAVLAEVGRAITNPDTSGRGYYAVYTDIPRGRARYCAWHSDGTVNGFHVQYAFFFKLDGDPGCDPNSTVSSESQGLQALANVSGHELSEARTDPNLNAWYDGSGSENADKCAWSFGSDYVTFANKTQWKIQGNWSNWAYDHLKGYANLSGQNGCLDGGGFPLPASFG